MRFSELTTDEAVLAELGERISRTRINQQMTQAVLAEEAGISKRTLERMEAGESTQLDNFLRVLRVLGLQDGLEALIPDPSPRPLDLLKLKGKERQRASSPSVVSEPEPWTWGEDS